MYRVKLKADIIVTFPSKKTQEETAEILLDLEQKLNKMKSIFFPKNGKWFNVFTRFHFDGDSLEQID
jgi:hypothetical protein